MWKQFGLAYMCQPIEAALLAREIWTVDSAKDFRVNAVTYAVLEATHWSPLEERWRVWFRASYGLTFVLQVPPENSYFRLNVPLWTQIYAQMDAGDFPDLNQCWLLRFPDSQGGQWPVLWPE